MTDNQRLEMYALMEQAKKDQEAKVFSNVETKKAECLSSIAEPPEKQEKQKMKVKEIAGEAIYAGAVASLQDKDYQEKVKKQARQALGTELKTQQNILDSDEQESMYDANSEACDSFGINKGVPTWQIKMMRFGHAIWFCVYYVVAFFTVCPITIFTKMFVHFVKKNWLAFIIAILIWAMIMASPIIGVWVSKIVQAGQQAQQEAASLAASISSL